jgi:hypothetical protein
MGYKTNGCDTGSIPMYLILPLLEKHSIPYLIETGTANGQSVRDAAPYFKKCTTIELISDRPAIKDAPKNIEFLIGQSVELLPDIIEELNELKQTEGNLTENNVKQQFVLFFLDAHYSDDVPNTSDIPECPVLEEIKLISKYGDDAILLIDDLRLFIGSTPYPCNANEWASLDDIMNTLRTLFPYHYNTIVDDYIISIPVHIKEVWDKEWRDRFEIRYPSEQQKLKANAQYVYKEFLNYIK